MKINIKYKSNWVFCLAVFTCILCSNNDLFSQKQQTANKVGLPFIQKFTPEEYNGHNQSFDIIQDKNGLIYVGNVNGVLVFDGVTWRTIELPNNKVAFSLKIGPDGIIYVGSQVEFGYLGKDQNNQTEYKSLSSKITSSFHDFGNIWEINFDTLGVVFSSRTTAIRYQSETFQYWTTDNRFSELIVIDDIVNVYQPTTGFAPLDRDSLEWKVPVNGLNQNVAHLSTYGSDSILLSSVEDGFFWLQNDSLIPWPRNGWKDKSKRLTFHKRLNNNWLALATYGLTVLDNEGDLVYELNASNGFTDHFVSKMVQDRQNGLWCATFDGIYRVEVQSPFSLYDKRMGVQGYVNMIHESNSKIYLGAETGVHSLDLNSEVTNQPFIRTLKQGAQFIDFEQTEHSLMAGGREGLFIIQNEKIENILARQVGGIHLSRRDKELLFVGLRAGLVVMRKQNGIWKEDGRFPSIKNDIRRIEEDENGNLWLEPQVGGIYRINIRDGYTPDFYNTPVKYYRSGQELPSDYVFLENFGDGVVFTIEGEQYKYDQALDSILLDKNFETLFGFNTERALLQTNDLQDFWIKSATNPTDSKDLYHAKWNGSSFDKTRIDNRRININVNTTFLKDHNGDLWYGGPSGVIHQKLDISPNFEKEYSALIRRVILNKDSVIYGGVGQYSNNKLKYGQDFRFEYALPSYDDISANRFQYMLDGYDDDWSDWSAEAFKEYTKLPKGDYVFRVRGKNIYQQVSEETKLELTISPPWYATIWAYIGYILGLIALGSFYSQWRSAKFKKENLLLQKLVNENTQELKERNDLLQNQQLILERQKEELTELGNLKSRLFTQISHDFRTPLTIIKAKTNQLNIGETDKKILHRNADNLLYLVDQILDLNKVENQLWETNFIQTDLIAFLKANIAPFIDFARSQDKKFTVDINEESLVLDLDINIMQRILYNLLSNALKYSEAGNTIGIELEVETDFYAIHIFDTGSGIDQDELENIFDLYYQIESSKQINGSGIGLFLVKELVNLLKGSIKVSSSIKMGTLFIVSIPITNSAPLQSKINISEPLLGLPNNTSPSVFKLDSQEEFPYSVLIIEDNSDLRALMKNLLSDHYEVHLAANGEEGLQMVKLYSPDIILADIMMPVMDGLEFTKLIKGDKILNHIPVILLTAKADQESINEGLKIGAEGYLTKPFNEEEVLNRIDNFIKLKEKFKEKYGSLVFSEIEKNIDRDQKDFVKELNDIITENLTNEKFGIPELTKRLGTNHVTLNKKIRSIAGVTSSNYIKRFKLNVAHKLVTETNLTLSEISFKIGISDPTYFTKLFKAEFQILPSKLREN